MSLNNASSTGMIQNVPD